MLKDGDGGVAQVVADQAEFSSPSPAGGGRLA
jgi:hypothetical protein